LNYPSERPDKTRDKEEQMYARLKSLQTRHEILESKIQGEMMRPRPDEVRLTLLKRMKLKLRDEIAGIERGLEARRQMKSGAPISGTAA
jgi:hypothetical protein